MLSLAFFIDMLSVIVLAVVMQNVVVLSVVTPRLYIFLTKEATLMSRSTVLSLPLQLVFPGLMLKASVKLMCLKFDNKPALV